MDFKSEKKIALKAAKAASKIILKHYGKKESIKEKPNKSLVATADLESNKAIIKEIKKNFPNHDILSEETGFDNYKSDYRWIIDPIDGTHNFLHSIPIFGVSIALQYKGKTVLGILEFPKLGITAIAQKGKGAFVNGKKVKVSSHRGLDHALVLIEFSFSRRKEKTQFLGKLIHRPIDIRNMGSAIIHLLLVATGKSDGFVILHTHEWDVAAGFLLVEEAGGKITGLDGKPAELEQGQFIVTNGKIHSELLKIIKT